MITSTTKERAEFYKAFQSLKTDSKEIHISCHEIAQKDLSVYINDITCSDPGLRLGSCYVIGRLLDNEKTDGLSLSSFQTSSIISSLVLALSKCVDSTEAAQILWALKRTRLVSTDAVVSHLQVLFDACQHATSTIKSTIQNSRNSYAVNAAVLQLISKLLDNHADIMDSKVSQWLPLVLPSCCHHLCKILCTSAQEIIEKSEKFLIKRAEEVRPLIIRHSEQLMGNITSILVSDCDDASKTFSIQFWDILVRIIGHDIENVYTTNLYLSALSRAFSKSSPVRQKQAFMAWTTLVNTLSNGYLLLPRVRKQILIPLCKSNKVNDKDAMSARFTCWWALVLRLGSNIQELFSEVCKPLLEFCLPSDNLTAGPGKGKPLPCQIKSMSRECLAVLLQFLGQREAFCGIQLGDDQRNWILTPVIIRDCGKVLLHALSESFLYISTSGDMKDMAGPVLNASKKLVDYFVDFSKQLGVNDSLVRELVRLLFSVLLSARKMIGPSKILELLEPVTEFDAEILSSTAFTPPEITNLSMNPSLCFMEALCYIRFLTYMYSESDRFDNCLCLLISKGSTISLRGAAAAYSAKVIEILSALCQMSDGQLGKSVVWQSVTKILADFISDEEDNSHKAQYIDQLVSAFVAVPSSSLLKVLESCRDIVFSIFELGDNYFYQAEKLWKVVTDRLKLQASLNPNFLLGVVSPLLCATFTHPCGGLRDLSLWLWEEHFSKAEHLDYTDDLCSVLAAVKQEKPDLLLPSWREPLKSIKLLPPAVNNPAAPQSPHKGRSPSTSDPSPKALLGRSPLKSINKKQLIIPRSKIISPVRLKTQSEPIPIDQNTSSKFLTPRKQQQIAEKTPEKCLFKSKRDDRVTEEVLAVPLDESTSELIQSSSLLTPRISPCENNLSSSSQFISQCDDGATQKRNETEADQMEIVSTPNQPIKSPVMRTPDTADRSMPDAFTPMHFTSPTSCSPGRGIKLTPCVVRVKKEKLIEDFIIQSSPDCNSQSSIQASDIPEEKLSVTPIDLKANYGLQRKRRKTLPLALSNTETKSSAIRRSQRNSEISSSQDNSQSEESSSQTDFVLQISKSRKSRRISSITSSQESILSEEDSSQPNTPSQQKKLKLPKEECREEIKALRIHKTSQRNASISSSQESILSEESSSQSNTPSQNKKFKRANVEEEEKDLVFSSMIEFSCKSHTQSVLMVKDLNSNIQTFNNVAIVKLKRKNKTSHMTSSQDSEYELSCKNGSSGESQQDQNFDSVSTKDSFFDLPIDKKEVTEVEALLGELPSVSSQLSLSDFLSGKAHPEKGATLTSENLKSSTESEKSGEPSVPAPAEIVMTQCDDDIFFCSQYVKQKHEQISVVTETAIKKHQLAPEDPAEKPHPLNSSSLTLNGNGAAEGVVADHNQVKEPVTVNSPSMASSSASATVTSSSESLSQNLYSHTTSSVTMSEKVQAAEPQSPPTKVSSEEDSGSTVSVKNVGNGTPNLNSPLVKKFMSSRSSLIFAKAMSRSPQPSSPTRMTHVDTLPATPKSSKRKIEDIFDKNSTPSSSPKTNSILKRRRQQGSPSGVLTQPKKVKFCIPIDSEQANSSKSKESEDQEILGMYSQQNSSGHMSSNLQNSNPIESSNGEAFSEHGVNISNLSGESKDTPSSVSGSDSVTQSSNGTPAQSESLSDHENLVQSDNQTLSNEQGSSGNSQTVNITSLDLENQEPQDAHTTSQTTTSSTEHNVGKLRTAETEAICDMQSMAPEVQAEGVSEKAEHSESADSGESVAPDFTDCELPIESIVNHLCIPLWAGVLRQCLRSQNINTVGDLARLSEPEISLLPIKVPKLDTLMEAFVKCGATKSLSKIPDVKAKDLLIQIRELSMDRNTSDATLRQKLLELLKF